MACTRHMIHRTWNNNLMAKPSWCVCCVLCRRFVKLKVDIGHSMKWKRRKFDSTEPTKAVDLLFLLFFHSTWSNFQCLTHIQQRCRWLIGFHVWERLVISNDVIDKKKRLHTEYTVILSLISQNCFFIRSWLRWKKCILIQIQLVFSVEFPVHSTLLKFIWPNGVKNFRNCEKCFEWTRGNCWLVEIYLKLRNSNESITLCETIFLEICWCISWWQWRMHSELNTETGLPVLCSWNASTKQWMKQTVSMATYCTAHRAYSTTFVQRYIVRLQKWNAQEIRVKN